MAWQRFSPSGKLRVIDLAHRPLLQFNPLRSPRIALGDGGIVDPAKIPLRLPLGPTDSLRRLTDNVVVLWGDRVLNGRITRTDHHDSLTFEVLGVI